jgi:aminopeptidase-like protein
MHSLIRELYPICRSITGDGVRQTLSLLRRYVPLDVHEVPTGTPVFDWTIPEEWNIQDGYIKNTRGERLIDFQDCNLHVVGYSVPVHQRLKMDALAPHLFTLPEYPDRVPYRTSYYSRTWGFCLSQNQLATLTDDEYEVCIDSSLSAGSLTYGELYVPGELVDEVLVSCHVCHPSLCNDNLSGIAMATALAMRLQSQARRYSYRFLFIPGTIGSIAWLSRNQQTARRIRHGLVLTCVGDAGHVTYKRSRRGTADIDRAMEYVLTQSGASCSIIDFSPWGYDERQYCSPGFDLPVGCFMRTPHGRFSEYHTSADNPDFVHPSALADSLATCMVTLEVLEANRTYLNTNPQCEPQLGRRGLYGTIGGRPEPVQLQMAMLWVLNFSDGAHSLLDIAERSGIAFDTICEAASALGKASLLDELPSVSTSPERRG